MQLVSVIIPFFNTPVQFLQEAIESVLAQRYDKWEMLLVDDGSTGECSRIAQYYTQLYPEKIRCLEHDGHQNRGLIASRNLGINQAKGEYIAFLDADDVWLPNKLEEQVAILDSQPKAGMLYGNTLYWYSWTGRPEDAQRDYLPKLGIKSNTLIKPPALLPLFLQGKVAVPCPCSILLRREAVDRSGGLENEFKRMLDLYEDQVLYAKVCLHTPVYVSDACWDRYRQHPESMCAVSENTGQEDFSRSLYLKWLAGYLNEQGIKDRTVWQALQMELWFTRHPFWGRRIKRAQRLVWRLKGLNLLTSCSAP